MTIIYANCPRCGAENAKFDVNGCNDISYYKTIARTKDIFDEFPPFEMCDQYELFAICEKCERASIFIISEEFDYGEYRVKSRDIPTNIEGSLNHLFEFDGHVLSRHTTMYPPPDYIPEKIKIFFEEGTACISNETWNSAGTMFRICLELVVGYKLTKEDLKELEKDKKTDLYDKINKLSQENRLSDDLKSIATFIREDGNDSAHGSVILTKEDAMELLSFTKLLLEIIYTKPADIKAKIEKRVRRKAAEKPKGR